MTFELKQDRDVGIGYRRKKGAVKVLQDEEVNRYRRLNDLIL
jgi:hypothetical protein